MKVIDVASTGTKKSLAFIDYFDGRGELREIEEGIYPPHQVALGREFREFRTKCGLTLGECSRTLGLTVVEVSEIERGRKKFETLQDELQATRLMSAWKENHVK